MSKLNRPRLADLIGETEKAAFARIFDQAGAAGDISPLPPGRYRCRISEAAFRASKKKTPGYELTFTVAEGAYAGRKVWHTLWLTEAAIRMSKRDLAKLGITSFSMLDEHDPTGTVCDVQVVIRNDNEGRQRNNVRSFDVVGFAADPTADEDFASPLPEDFDGGAV
jgi:hypothetical protein